MGLKHYGVLRGRVLAARREDDMDSPHYQVQVAAAGTNYRLAVNVMSQLSPSELLFIVIEDFQHPLTQKLSALAEGFTTLPKQPDTAALDFIRGNLFNRLDMRLLPPSLPGDDNDLSDRLAHYVDRAASEPDAVIYAFGERWGPEPGNPDKIFHFEPGNGVHDIHMNQGNDPGHRGDDGVWQDGGLVLRFPSTDQWVAIFLAFQSQAWHTDDRPATPCRAPPRTGTGAASGRARLPGSDRGRAGQPGRARPRGRDRHPAQRDAGCDRSRRLAADRQGGADPERSTGGSRPERRAWCRSSTAGGARQQGRDDHPGRCRRAQGRWRRLHQGAGLQRGLDDRVLSERRSRAKGAAVLQRSRAGAAAPACTTSSW